MDDRIIQFRVGVVVIAAVLIAGTLVLWFGGEIRDTYTIYLKYPSAPNVTIDTPVRKNGVRIGRVTQVDLLDDGVLLTMKVDQGRKLRTSEQPRIVTASILGDAVVEFVLLNKSEWPDEVREIQDGETLIGDNATAGSPTEVLQMVVEMQDNIEAAFGAVESAGTKIAELTDGLKSVVGGNDDEMKTILLKTNRALDQFTAAVGNVNEVIGDPQVKSDLKRTFASLPKTVNEANQTLAEAKTTLRSFVQLKESAQRNLDNLQGLTQPLGERGDEFAAAIQQSIVQFQQALAQLVAFTETLNNSEGSLGRFVHDRELYDRVNRAAANVEEVTRRLKPLMYDARILTDKLARDPSQLGLRGAIARQNERGQKYPVYGQRESGDDSLRAESNPRRRR